MGLIYGVVTLIGTVEPAIKCDYISQQDYLKIRTNSYLVTKDLVHDSAPAGLEFGQTYQIESVFKPNYRMSRNEDDSVTLETLPVVFR